MVGSLDDVQVVLHDDHGIALVHQTVEHAEQDTDVLEVQTRGGLVQNVQGAARIALGKFGGQFHSLALASRQGGTGLAEFDITKTNVLKHLYLLQDGRLVLEELHRLVYGHVQNVCYTLATEAHLQSLTVVALATALLARHHNIGQEVHLYALVSIARTSLAPSTLHIEREAAGLVATNLCLGKVHEEVAYVVEHIGVCGRVAARSTTEGSLVNIHHLVHVLQALHRIVWQGVGERAVEVLRKDWVQGVVDERALARTAHTRYADEFAKGEGGGNVLQVISLGAMYGNAFAVA